MLDFYLSIWTSFILFSFGGIGLFLSKDVRFIFYFSIISLCGVFGNFITTSCSLNNASGKMIVFFLILTFMTGTAVELYLLKKEKEIRLAPLFFALPFMSFFLIASSQDLLGFIIGIEGFQVALNILSFRREYFKPIRIPLFKAGIVSFVALTYGFSILYLTRGQIQFHALQKTITPIQPLNTFISIGIELIALGIIIKVNNFIQITRKNHASF